MPRAEGKSRDCFLAHRNRSDFCDLRLRCPSRTPEIARFPRQDKAMLHCDLRVRWKVASDLLFRAAISEPKAPSFCGISGDLAHSTRKSLAIAIMRLFCAEDCFRSFTFSFWELQSLGSVVFADDSTAQKRDVYIVPEWGNSLCTV